MGNEASMEGGGQPGEPGAAAGMMGSVMPGGPTSGAGAGQHMKPINGAAAGGGMGVGGPGMGMTRYGQCWDNVEEGELRVNSIPCAT